MSFVRTSTDSFVDIVSNTTGIVIILTLMATVLGEWASHEVDRDRRYLAELNREIRELQDLRNLLPSLLEQSREDRIHTQNQIAGLNDRYVNHRRDLEELRARQAELLQQMELLEQLAELDVAVLEQRLAEAERLLQQLAASLSESELPPILQATLAEMEGRRSSLLSDVENQARDLEALRQSIRDLQASLEDLQRVLEETAGRRQVMEQEWRPVLVLPNPVESRMLGSQPVWVECFRDENQVPRVRLVTSEAYERLEDGWHPRSPGSTIEQMQVGEGLWSQIDLSPQEGRPDRYIYAVVRPDGFESYHALRDWANARDWRVEWTPFPAGDIIPLRQRGR